MSTKSLVYKLDKINQVLCEGFDYRLPDETIQIITTLSHQVGSPSYIKTPIFEKKDMTLVAASFQEKSGGKSFVNTGYGNNVGGLNKRNKKDRGKVVEIMNDSEWETIKTTSNVTATKGTKSNEETQVDAIRVLLNKLTDKNYIDICGKIDDILHTMTTAGENITGVCTILFDIASANKFYSKIYADLYSQFSLKYSVFQTILQENISNFIELFNHIECVDPAVDYNKFCEINKVNDKRKALAAFYLNLMLNDIISKDIIINITHTLLVQLYAFIHEEGKKSEVEELTETIAILYRKELYMIYNGTRDYELIGGYRINELVVFLSKSKVKDYKSLTNKVIFKYMDLVEV